MYPEWNWNNDKGSGKLQGMEFMDAYGSMIEATMFNDDVEKFNKILKEGKIYIISNASVKVANQKFARVKNDYSLSFHKDTNIWEDDDDFNISKRGFNPTSISKLFSLAQLPSTVDILGVIVSISDCTEISTKKGSLLEKRNITILDWSVPSDPDAVNPPPKLWGAWVNATMWGEIAKNPRFDVGDIVCFKSVQFTEFFGSWSINISGGSDIFTDLDDNQEADILKKWYKKVSDLV